MEYFKSFMQAGWILREIWKWIRPDISVDFERAKFGKHSYGNVKRVESASYIIEWWQDVENVSGFTSFDAHYFLSSGSMREAPVYLTSQFGAFFVGMPHLRKARVTQSQ